MPIMAGREGGPEQEGARENKVEEEMEKEDKEGLSVKKSNDPPRFAHICKTV